MQESNPWENLQLVQKMNYCRGNLTVKCDHKDCDCKPLIVANIEDGTSEDTREWVWEGFEKDGITPVRFQCIFTGKKNKSGARAMLEKYS